MKSLIAILLTCLSLYTIQAQELNESILPELVVLVDEQLDLSNSQEKEFLKILGESYRQLKAVQTSEKTEIEKLNQIRLNQQVIDSKLKVLFSPEQYTAYKEMIHGPSYNESESMLQAGTSAYSGRVTALANELDLKGDDREQFTTLLNELERKTTGILKNAVSKEQAGLDILVEILSCDLELIDLLGKPVYETFYNRRAEGALSGDNSFGGNADIDIVLMFYDIAHELDLSKRQTSEVVRFVLVNEGKKNDIREEFKNSPAMMQEKMRSQKQQGLLELQALLSPGQVEKLLDLLGQ